MDGSVNFTRKGLTTGSQEGFSAALSIKQEAIELSLSGDVSEGVDIVSETEHKSKADSVKFGLKLLKFKDFPLSINYSTHPMRTYRRVWPPRR